MKSGQFHKKTTKRISQDAHEQNRGLFLFGS